MVICLERGAHLHMTQLMPLPLTVSCFSKIQIGFSFLVPAHPLFVFYGKYKCTRQLKSFWHSSGSKRPLLELVGSQVLEAWSP